MLASDLTCERLQTILSNRHICDSLTASVDIMINSNPEYMSEITSCILT